MDFIIAWDADEDANPYNWNNGTNLHNTYLRTSLSNIPFPTVPSASTFILRNYTSRPVFFGCSTHRTTTNSTDSPIVLYLANSPYSGYTNYSYTQNVMQREQIYEIYTNSFDMLTQGNGTVGGSEDFVECLGCAVVERSRGKVGMRRTEQCRACLEKWSWDGEEAIGEVGVEPDGGFAVVDLRLALDPELGFVEWNRTHPF